MTYVSLITIKTSLRSWSLGVYGTPNILGKYYLSTIGFTAILSFCVSMTVVY